MTYLAVSIAAPDTAAALTALHDAVKVADLAELRLDLMQEFDLPRLLVERPLPVIITCRPRREGGAWQGGEGQRLAVLERAAALGADYVDVEWDCAVQASQFDRSRTKLILSRHDYHAMPGDLAALAASLWAAGADVVKVVGTAQQLADVAPLLQLLKAAVRPTIAIAMGPYGLISRVLAFRYPHAFLSFAAPDPPRGQGKALCATAPGQLTAKTMRDLYRVRCLTAHTDLIGLQAPDANTRAVGRRANRWLKAQGLDAVVLPLQPAAGEDIAEAMAALASVTPWRGHLLEPPFGCQMPEGRVGNTIRTARGQQSCAAIDCLPERLRWILTGQTEAGDA